MALGKLVGVLALLVLALLPTADAQCPNGNPEVNPTFDANFEVPAPGWLLPHALPHRTAAG
jgi:hypothetical protein